MKMSAYVSSRATSNRAATGIVSRMANAFSAWNDARATRNALAKLSDRELDDIGLSRSDIDSVAARA
jgi:uncharacterized protein YjiS (DUF1127 family)